MKTILIATDFSAGSENARKYGLSLAKNNGHSVKYIHAYTPPVLDPNIPVGLIEETFTETISVIEDNLKKIVEQDLQMGVKSSFLISYSDINSMIEDASQDIDLEMVIVGKTGHTGFLDKVIGSTAEHLVNHIKSPLLIIPEEYDGDIYELICYASELEYDEEKFIEKTLKWKQHSKNNLIIGHIFEKYGLNLRPDSQFLNSINKSFKNSGIKIIEKAAKTFHRGIVDLIQEEKISLLVLTTHKRGFLDGLINPSKTKSIISDTKIPVLVFSFD
ncbi:MAG: universal stress protein [Cytophagaceae bacterium]|nr:universal stress protein [Cytophagaceae bacterium]MBK9932636.1 universal stress protein [Cytophagaceae bacterium]MBL0303673.1 universal stress protein [Cytophagaceae bacterium]MBL0326503.1 universal stress protein [Cytophagaceae bacterium]